MNRDFFDELGDRHKKFEAMTESKLMPGLPVIIRLDGRAFHTFTKGMKRPYDPTMSYCMIDTTKYLVHHLGANFGYCQSDEITLGFRNDDIKTEMMFGGRVQKLVSISAAMASVEFNKQILSNMPEKVRMAPIFDARVFQYPTLALATENVLWRELDATRNSLTMACHAHFPQSQLFKVGFKGKHDLLHTIGINWNDYPAFFKRGTYVSKRVELKELTLDELARIPEKYRPTEPVLRNVVEKMVMPIFTTVENKIGVLFYNEMPVESAESN